MNKLRKPIDASRSQNPIMIGIRAIDCNCCLRDVDGRTAFSPESMVVTNDEVRVSVTLSCIYELLL